MNEGRSQPSALRILKCQVTPALAELAADATETSAASLLGIVGVTQEFSAMGKGINHCKSNSWLQALIGCQGLQLFP
jgi:hypothetical protein